MYLYSIKALTCYIATYLLKGLCNYLLLNLIDKVTLITLI